MAKVTGPTDPSVKIQPPTPPDSKENRALELGRNLINIFRKGIPVEIVNIAFDNPRLSSAAVNEKREFTDDDLTVLGTEWLRAIKSKRDTVITYIKMLGKDTSSIIVK